MRRIAFLVLLLFSTAGASSAEPFSTESQEGLTLPEAVRYALEHSPDLQAAKAEVAQREGTATTERSALFPQIEVLGDVTHTGYDHGYPPATPPQVIRFDDTLFMAGAEFKFLVWDFGQTAKEVAAAKKRILSGKAAQDRRTQQVIYAVASLYLQTLTYVDLADAAQSTRTSLQALLQRTQDLAEAGRAVPADVLKVSTRLAQIESDLATLEAKRQASISQLCAAMGLEGEPPRLAYTPPVTGPLPAPGSEAELVREAVAHRPDLASSQSEIEAARDHETAVRRSRLPRTDLRAGAYQTFAFDPVSSFDRQGPKPDDAAGDWIVGLHLTLPVFDAGRRSGQIRSAAAQTERARAAERRLRLDVESEVRSALAELASAEKRVEATQQSVAQAEEVLRTERLKYEAGRGVINFVLDAEAALLTSKSLLRQAQRSVSLDMLLLDLALGRLTPTSTSSP